MLVVEYKQYINIKFICPRSRSHFWEYVITRLCLRETVHCWCCVRVLVNSPATTLVMSSVRPDDEGLAEPFEDDYQLEDLDTGESAQVYDVNSGEG
jgi:hypothetical protein